MKAVIAKTRSVHSGGDGSNWTLPPRPASGASRTVRSLRKARQATHAFSLAELLAAVAILGIIAAYVIPRVAAHHETALKNACWTHQGEIELQAKLWRRNNGSYPAMNLSNIGADPDYFPEGLPTCPVDGTAYTIDTTTGLVVGHAH